jgi:hypothetical protein
MVPMDILVKALVESPEASSKELAAGLGLDLQEVVQAYRGLKGALKPLPDMPSGPADVLRKILERDVLDANARRFLDAFHRREFIFPDRLELHLGPGCQCCCRFCWRWESGAWKEGDRGLYQPLKPGSSSFRYLLEKGVRGNAGLLSPDQLKNLLAEFKQSSQVPNPILYLSGGLEFLTSDMATLALSEARRHEMQTKVYTNGVDGSLDKDEFLELLVESADLVRFSIHANTGKTYAWLQMPHKPADFGEAEFLKVRNRVERLVERRNRKHRGRPTIAVAYLVVGRNIDELRPAVEWMRKAGVDECDVRVNMQKGQSWFTPAEKDQLGKVVSEVRDQTEKGAYAPLKVNARVGQDSDLADKLRTTERWPSCCYIPLKKPTVDPWGYVHKCCYRAHPSLQQADSILGKYPEKSLRQILQSAFDDQYVPQRPHCPECIDWELAYNKCVERVLADWQAGIPPDELPFL